MNPLFSFGPPEPKSDSADALPSFRAVAAAATGIMGPPASAGGPNTGPNPKLGGMRSVWPPAAAGAGSRPDGDWRHFAGSPAAVGPGPLPPMESSVFKFPRASLWAPQSRTGSPRDGDGARHATWHRAGPAAAVTRAGAGPLGPPHWHGPLSGVLHLPFDGSVRGLGAARPSGVPSESVTMMGAPRVPAAGRHGGSSSLVRPSL